MKGCELRKVIPATSVDKGKNWLVVSHHYPVCYLYGPHLQFTFNSAGCDLDVRIFLLQQACSLTNCCNFSVIVCRLVCIVLSEHALVHAVS